MNREQKVKNYEKKFFRKGNKKYVEDSFLKKLGSSFLLTSVIMIIAGVIRGIGLLIISIVSQDSGFDTNSLTFKVGQFIDQLGGYLFLFMPLFYAVSISIIFTKDHSKRGFAALASVVAFVMFSAFQIIFIIPDSGRTTFTVLFYSGLDKGLFTNLLGFSVLNTTVVSGILCGAISACLMNKFGNHELHHLIKFFEKERIAIILSIFSSWLLGILFLIIWPIIGIGLMALGKTANNAPLGVESLVYGMIERSLIPTGMNNVLNMIFQFTSAGGVLNNDFVINYSFNGVLYHTLGEFLKTNNPLLYQEIINQGGIVGDQNIWFFIDKTHIPFDIFRMHGLKPGHFLNGRFPYMLFGLLGVCLAISLSSAKNVRRQTMQVMMSYGLITFVTGTTMPIEFSFVFIAPWLFYGVHVPIVALNWWLMNVFGSNLGSAFSGGLIDYVIFGAIPDAFGMHVKSWIPIIIGLIDFIVYFASFYYLIRKFNVVTPGREILQNLSVLEAKKSSECFIQDWSRKIILILKLL